MIIWSCTIVLSFFVYSFFGWLWESTVCSLYNEKQLINRGFLVGPLCPIYGAGALCCYFALYHVQNPAAVFILSALLCCALEYLVSYTMEKMFHTRWWDYSDFPFHLNGRICLYGALAFGIGCFSVRFFVQPALFRLFSYMEPRGLLVVSVVFLVLFITDLLLTIANWKQLNKHLATIHAYLNGSANQIMENFSEKIPESLISDENGIRVKIRRVSVLLQKRELRFFGAFPKLKIYAYDKTIKKLQLKERWSEFRERKLKR